MRLDKGREALPTRLGALCSIMSLVILLTYASYKISILQSKKSIDVLQAVKEDHFNDLDKFTAKQGFNIAATVINPFVYSTQKPLDPSYGRIRFSYTQWSVNNSGILQNVTEEIESHECT